MLVGGWVWSLIGSSWLYARDAGNILAVDWNVRSASVTEIQNTPSGCAWPKPMYNSTKSFSWKESGENRVPLPWVATKMQMQFAKLWSSTRVTSCTTEVVAVDVMDIMGWERMGKSMYTGWRYGLRCDVQTNPLVSQQLQLVIYVILPMAGKWCSPEHSPHVAVTMQNLELDIPTATINMNQDRCDDKLQNEIH